MSDEYELPDGWVTKPLGDAARLVKAKVDPKTVPDANYVGLEHVEAHSMGLLGHGRGSDVKSAKTKFAAGDVLYGKLRPYLNKVAQPSFDGISSTDFLVFTESDELNPAYLAQFLNQLSVANYAHHLSAGVELPRVDWKSLSTLPISFPVSKAEQSALVGQLERARSLGASADAHLARARRAIERFRYAVLAAACSGRLTADWRDRNPDNAGASEEVAEHGVSAAKVRRGVDPSVPPAAFEGLPATWSTFTVAQLLSLGILDDVKDGNHGAVHPKVSEFTEEGLPFIAANLVRGGRIDYAAAPRVAGAVLGRLRVGFSHPGDVVLTHKGTVGRVAVATQEAVLTPQTTYYRSNGLIDPEYLAIFFESLFFYEQLAQVMSQTTRDFVPITQQYKLTLVLPPRAEQVEIVHRVSALLATAESLLGRIDAGRRRVDRSSQAVLAKAFRGELSTPRVEGSS